MDAPVRSLSAVSDTYCSSSSVICMRWLMTSSYIMLHHDQSFDDFVSTHGNQTVCPQRHIRMTRTLPIASFVVAMATFTVAGCTGDNPDAAPTVPTVTAPTTTEAPDTTTTDPTTPTSTPSHGPAKFSALGSTRLRFFAECPDLLAYMQDEATKRVTSWGLGGQGWGRYYPGGPVPMMEASAAGAATDDKAAAAAARDRRAELLGNEHARGRSRRG